MSTRLLDFASKHVFQFFSLQDLVEVTRVMMIAPQTQVKLTSALELFVETTQDFTDSAYTTHQHRERIIHLCDKLRFELSHLIKIGSSLVSGWD